jgi:hypothetical protein
MSFHTYFMDECRLEIPFGFTDRSVHVLDWPIGDGDVVGLVVVREKLPPPAPEPPPPSEYLRTLVTQRSRDFPSQFPGYRAEQEEAGTTAAEGLAVRRKTFRWRKEQDVIYHHHVYVLMGEQSLMTFTGVAKATHREAVDELVQQTLYSLCLRTE